MTLAPGDRVKLSSEGVRALLGEIIKGKLTHPVRRRSCNNRKLTEFSLGMVLSVTSHPEAVGRARVKFDHLASARTFALRFLKKALRVLP